MADDYSINAKITADASGFKSGVNTAIKSSKSLSSSIQGMVQGLGQNGLVGSLAGAGLALGGVGVALGAAKKAFQAVAKVVAECSEAYKKQRIAEEQLSLAVKNSSAVTEGSAKVLKDYASSLQKASNYGDEELLPMMTKLISSGRTEAETMKIMKTAIDMSATGTVSLDTAINQLNMTLNGNVGRLAMQNKELKGLTKEELENGKAVDILAGKYAGMAEKSIDSSKQLQNAWGDLKETMGRAFENALSPMRTFFATLIQGWADARKERQDYYDAEKRIEEGKGELNDYLLKQKDLQEQIANLEAQINKDELEYEETAREWGEEKESLYSDEHKSHLKILKDLRDELATIELQIDLTQKRQKSEKALEEQKNKEAEAEERRLQAIENRNKTASDLKKRYEEAEQKQLITWEQNAKLLDKTVTTEEKVLWYKEQLVSIMAESNGLITEGNAYYDKQIKKIKALEEELKGAEKPSGKLENNFEDMAKTVKGQLKSAFTGVFTQLGESLVEGGKSFEDYASTAVSSIAEILKALAEELMAQVAVNVATGNYIGAGKALASATAVLVGAGALSAMASRMTAIKEATLDATSSIEKFKESLKEIQETRFSKAGTVSLGLVEMQDKLDLLREKQAKLYAENKSFFDYYSGGWNHSRETLVNGVKQGIPNYQKMLNLYDEYHNTLKQITEVEKQLSEALENVRSSLDDSVAENRKVINSYKDFYGATKLIADSAGYQYQKYSTYIEMIKQEQKVGLQELESDVYDTFQNLGRNIGEAMLSSFMNGTDKADFFNEMKTFIRETVLKMAVYTESFTDQLSEVGADLVSALMGGEDLEDVTKRITTLYDETSKIAERFSDKIDDIFGKVEKDMGIAISAFAKNMKSFKETIKDVTGDLGQTFINGLTEGITQGDFLTNMKDYLRKLMIQMVVYTDTMKAEIEEIGKRISAGIVDGFTDTDLHEIRRDMSYMFEEASRKVQSIDSLLGGVFGGYVTGTNNARRGLAMVGEVGPELVQFRGGEQVLNSKNTQRALNNMGGNTNNFNVTFNNTTDTSAFAVIQQLKTYNRQMAINGVI